MRNSIKTKIFKLSFFYRIMEKEINSMLKTAKKDKEILAIALFGSKARGEPSRDIDICIFLNKKLSNLEMTEKRLKYLNETNEKLDIQIFQQLPLYIRTRVLKDGKILFCKDEDKLYELAFQTIKEFESYEKLFKMYLNEVKNGSRKNFNKI